MKKLFVTTFATAFVLALALPAAAQSVCGSAGTEGMPTCSAVKAGTGCCVPPAAKIATDTVKPHKKVPHMLAHQQQQEMVAQPTLPAVKSPKTTIGNTTVSQQQQQQPAMMATGPQGGNGSGKPTISHRPISAAPAAAPAMSAGKGASAAPAAAPAMSAGRGASAGGVSAGGARGASGSSAPAASRR